MLSARSGQEAIDLYYENKDGIDIIVLDMIIPEMGGGQTYDALRGINPDAPRNLAKVKPFARSIGITYPVLLDVNSEVMAQLRVTGVPTLLVVDAEREILLLHEGYRPGDARFLGEELERLLEEQSAEQ